MCLPCLARLPRTGFHRLPDNRLHERLASPGVDVARAAAWFTYMKKNEFAAMIHDAKYHGQWALARDCGRLYGAELMADGFFNGIDLLLPVPMHGSKLRRRGYNQAVEVARGISEATGIPVGNNLVARRGHDSQTRRNAWQRWLNARDIYAVERPAELAGKHVAVVDDVVTTGATLLACLTALHSAGVPHLTTSVTVLAATSTN